MELLQAVNTVLPHLGEHVITRVEGSKHPTVDLILAAIDRVRIRTLSEGLWFNDREVTLPVNTDGRISTPTNTLAVYGVGCSVELQGQHLLDLDESTTYFTKPIKVRLIRDVPFEYLPLNVALYCTYEAACEVYTQDFGYEKSYDVLQQLASKAWVKVSQENLRKEKYNSQKRSRRRFTNAVKFR